MPGKSTLLNQTFSKCSVNLGFVGRKMREIDLDRGNNTALVTAEANHPLVPRAGRDWYDRGRLARLQG